MQNNNKITQNNTEIPENNTETPENNIETLNQNNNHSEMNIVFSLSDKIVYIFSIIILVLYISFSIYALIEKGAESTLLQAKQFLITYIVYSFLILINLVKDFYNGIPVLSNKKKSFYDKIIESFRAAIFIWDCILLFKEIGFEHCWEKNAYKIITIYFFSNIVIIGIFSIFCLLFIFCICCCSSCFEFCLKKFNNSDTPIQTIAIPIFGNINLNQNSNVNAEAFHIVSINIDNTPTAQAVNIPTAKIVVTDIENQ